MKHLIGILCTIAFAVIHTTADAQQQTPAQKHLMKEDSAAVNALVMYPDTIRLDIFEACEYPSAIVSIASLQKNSSDEFVNLISSYSKNEQEDFWNLSRYPGLISRLAQEGNGSIDQIITILRDYPAEIHETALEHGTKDHDVLQKMDEIQTRTDAQFDQILADYPTVTQEALRELIQFPEIINLLNDHLGLTVRVGDRYRRNPQGVIHKADSLNLAETRQNAADAESWKQTIEQNPDEADDLKNAADDYATENGYTQEEVNTAPDPDYVANYTCNPYSYWFGYPNWYPYSYWYPYPFWFDCGFYHDRHGKIMIIGSPSRYFTNWYFYYPEHWHRYPNLCNTYINHYYGRRRTAGANSTIVHSWVRERRNYLPKDFITNKSRRTEVIRQVAQLDIDAQKQSGGKPVSQTVRDSYFGRNVSKYPSLNAEQKPKIEEKQNDVLEGINRPEKQPAAKVMRPARVLGANPAQMTARPAYKSDAVQEPAKQPATRTVRPTQETDVNPSSTTPPPVYKSDIVPQPAREQRARIDRTLQEPAATSRPTTPRPAYNFNRINSAQEYQRNIWEQAQPTVRPQPQPPPRQVQQPQLAPRPQAQQPARQAPAPKNRPKEK